MWSEKDNTGLFPASLDPRKIPRSGSRHYFSHHKSGGAEPPLHLVSTPPFFQCHGMTLTSTERRCSNPCLKDQKENAMRQLGLGLWFKNVAVRNFLSKKKE